ncbi:MAG: DUF1868 domain-containing protein [Geitlerinemataceae cyanobacterium]
MDDSYQAYLERLAKMVRPDSYHSTLQYLRKSPKFARMADGTDRAVSFPGYTLISPTSEDDPANAGAYAAIDAAYADLLTRLPADWIIGLPLASYHMTIADLIWDSAYRDLSHSPDYDTKLRDRLGDLFSEVGPQVVGPKPVSWQVLGFVAMPRAIAVALVPVDDVSYRRTVRVRRSIYQDSAMVGLGIDQQYHFTAHVTLGYFGEIPADLDRLSIAAQLEAANERFSREKVVLSLDRAELRRFEDMVAYTREEGWPVLRWVAD